MYLNNIRLLVSDFDNMFLFYRDVLGFRVLWGNVGENYAEFQAGDSGTLALYPKAMMAEVVGSSHLSENADCQDNFALVFSVDDVDDCYNQLQSKGLAFVTQPVDKPVWGIRVTHARDPEGHLLEFCAEIKK